MYIQTARCDSTYSLLTQSVLTNVGRVDPDPSTSRTDGRTGSG